MLPALARFVLRSAYGAWTRTYRSLWEREYAPGAEEHEKLKQHAGQFGSIHDVAVVLYQKSDLYKPDSWKQLGDAVSWPARADAIFAGRLTDTTGLDCDEFAIWAYAVLSQHTVAWGIKSLSMMSVSWTGGKDVINGHNVCCIGWENGTWSFMDYGLPSKQVDTLEGLVQQVLAQYAQGGKLLAWARYEPITMTCVEVH